MSMPKPRLAVQKFDPGTLSAQIPNAGSARFFLFVDPFENVVMGSHAGRKKAVYRILLIRKDFEHCIELCQYIQAQMLDIEAHQLQRTAALPNLCVTQDQRLQTVAVDLCYLREVECDIHDIISRERVYHGTKVRFRIACFQLSSQIKNPNPLSFALTDVPVHGRF